MFKDSDPKLPFHVVNKVDLNSYDIKILVKLYQPLVGSLSLALYLTLVENFSAEAILSDAKGVYNLQEQLDCSLPQFYTALHKLEAVGLVKSLLLPNEVLGKVLAFELLKIPTAREFFKTSLLASLLKEKVGISNFKYLSQQFARDAKNKKSSLAGLAQAQNISASFIDVFRLPNQEAIEPSVEVKEAASENDVENPSVAQVNTQDSVNWQFIKQQFLIYQIPESEIEQNKNQIRGLMQTYGLSEQEFVNGTLSSLRGDYTLDMRKISHEFAQNYRLSSKKSEIKKTLKQKSPSFESGKFTSKEQRILAQAQAESPAHFLYKIKNASGGYVTAAENQLVNNLHNRDGLPVPLVNILVYTCLKINPKMLTSKLANTIANDWLQNGVKTAPGALEYVNKRNQNKYKKRPVYQKGYNKRVEKGTDWSKKKAKTADNVSSKELKNFFSDLENKNGMK